MNVQRLTIFLMLLGECTENPNICPYKFESFKLQDKLDCEAENALTEIEDDTVYYFEEDPELDCAKKALIKIEDDSFFSQYNPEAHSTLITDVDNDSALIDLDDDAEILENTESLLKQIDESFVQLYAVAMDAVSLKKLKEIAKHFATPETIKNGVVAALPIRTQIKELLYKVAVKEEFINRIKSTTRLEMLNRIVKNVGYTTFKALLAMFLMSLVPSCWGAELLAASGYSVSMFVLYVTETNMVKKLVSGTYKTATKAAVNLFKSYNGTKGINRYKNQKESIVTLQNLSLQTIEVEKSELMGSESDFITDHIAKIDYAEKMKKLEDLSNFESKSAFIENYVGKVDGTEKMKKLEDLSNFESDSDLIENYVGKVDHKTDKDDSKFQEEKKKSKILFDYKFRV